MSEVYDVIEKIINTSGTNAKIQVMKDLKYNPELERDFLRIVVATYNPYINYYIKKFTLNDEGSGDIRDVENLNVLAKIANREVSGKAAIHMLETMGNGLHWKSQQILNMIINKSFQGGGISRTSINKVWPGKIPVFNVMLCQPFNQKTIKKIKFPCYGQVKYDAARVTIIVKGDVVRYFTRNGKEYEINNQAINERFISMSKDYGKDCVFDGEIYQDGMDRVKSNAIATKFVRGTASLEDSINVCIVLWDVIPLSDFNIGKCKIEYFDRLKTLQDIVELMDRAFVYNVTYITVADTIMLYDIDQIKQYNEQSIANGEEGIVIKNIDGIWEGKRSNSSIKMKEELESEMKVVGSVYGLNKYSDMCGALVCESSDGKVKVSVGTGLSDELREIYSPSRADKTIIGKIITVRHNGLITDIHGDHSLYLPRFIEERHDKTVADNLTKIQSESKRG